MTSDQTPGTQTPGTQTPPAPAGERDELLRMLAEQRNTLLVTVRGIGDAEAARRTTVSELTLGGLLRHVAHCERAWMHVMTRQDGSLPDGMLNGDQHRMAEDQTLAGLIDDYAAAARETEAAVATLPDLDQQIPLPEFPWSPPERQYWSARRILLHLLRETAHHCGHADLIREALDGANTTRQLGEDRAKQSA
ncbi:DinB family protein [Streptomyces sp. NPDC092296]|uniref:DinB family protein n=1 Tax=Streptomyces sp. NPDC092296 TaxID=3366012 RepID=UPI0038057D5D